MYCYFVQKHRTLVTEYPSTTVKPVGPENLFTVSMSLQYENKMACMFLRSGVQFVFSISISFIRSGSTIKGFYRTIKVALIGYNEPISGKVKDAYAPMTVLGKHSKDI